MSYFKGKESDKYLEFLADVVDACFPDNKWSKRSDSIWAETYRRLLPQQTLAPSKLSQHTTSIFVFPFTVGSEKLFTFLRLQRIQSPPCSLELKPFPPLSFSLVSLLAGITSLFTSTYSTLSKPNLFPSFTKAMLFSFSEALQHLAIPTAKLQYLIMYCSR